MAKNIVVQMLGKDKHVVCANTVGEAIAAVPEFTQAMTKYPCWGYGINGEPTPKTAELSDGDFVFVHRSVIGFGPLGCFCACGEPCGHKELV